MGKSKDQSLILSLHNIGNPEFPRFVISNQYLQYWSGNDWTKQADESKASIYADSNSALEDMHKILLQIYKEKPVSRFCAPFHIELFSDDAITLNQLKDWLFKVMKLIMDTPKHGNGPLKSSYGTCWIDLSELKEIK
jgi:hypothetical protein